MENGVKFDQGAIDAMLNVIIAFGGLAILILGIYWVNNQPKDYDTMMKESQELLDDTNEKLNNMGYHVVTEEEAENVNALMESIKSTKYNKKDD